MKSFVLLALIVFGALTAARGDEQAAFSQLEKLVERGTYEEAETVAWSLIRQNGLPEYEKAEAYYWLSLIGLKKNNILSAIAHMEKAYSMGFDDLEIPRRIAVLYTTTQNTGKAQKWLREYEKRQKPLELTLEILRGKKEKLAKYRGKIVLVHFWATWCKPCVEEIPKLVELYDEYKDRGLEIVALSSDLDSEKKEVEKFVRDHNITFPVYYDFGGGTAVRVIGNRAIPATVVIDRHGRIRRKFVGKRDWQKMKPVIERYLEEK